MSVLAAGLIFAQLAVGGGLVPSSAFTVGDRSEARVRTVANLGAANRIAEDVETTIISSYLVHQRHTEYVLGYTPRLAYNDIEGGRQLSLLHTGHIGAAWWTRRLRLSLTIDGSVGSQSAVGLAAPIRFADVTTATPSPYPSASTVTYIPGTQVQVLNLGTLRGSITANDVLSRRWTLLMSGYYQIAGGFDFPSQQAFPPSHGPGASTTATYTINKFTQTSTRLRGDETTVLRTPIVTPGGGVRALPHRGGTFDTAELLQSIRHSFTRRTQFGMGGGVTLLRGPRQIDGRTVAVLNGAGDANLSHTVPLHADAVASFRIGAALGSAYNPALGVGQQQVSTTLAASWTRPRVGATATAGFVASIPTPIGPSDDSKSTSGGLVFDYAPLPILSFQAGVRGYWQLLPITTVIPAQPTAVPPVAARFQTNLETQGFQWAAFLAVLVTAPPLEL